MPQRKLNMRKEMSFYPKEQHKTPRLLKDAFFYYGKALKAAWLYIVLAVLAYNAYSVTHRFVMGRTGEISFLMAIALISLYFWSAALYATHGALQNRPTTVRECLGKTLQRFYKIVFVVVLYGLVFILTIFWLQTLNHLIGNASHMAMARWWLSLFLVGFPLLLFMLLFLLSIPLIIVNNDSFLRALGRSAKMVWLSIFKTTLVLYAGIIILGYMVLPYTQHTQWVIERQVKVIYDLVILVFLAPIVLNYALLLVNNLGIFMAQRSHSR